MSGVIGQDLHVKSGLIGFPAGHVLQVKGVRSTAATSNVTSATNKWMKSDGTGWDSTHGAAITLTTKQANSSFKLESRLTYFTNRATADGYQVFCNIYAYISTTLPTNDSTDGTEYFLVNYYEDCRSSNYVSGQQNNMLGGHAFITTTHYAGTTLYFSLKTNC